jgi:hypothetical protein
MKEIRLGLEHGLTPDQVKMYIDPRFKHTQMQQLRIGLEKGLDIERYAKFWYEVDQMQEIQLAQEHGVPFDRIDSHLTTILHYDKEQLKQIRLGLEHGLTDEQINLYQKSKYNHFRMEQMRLGLEHGLDKKQIKLFSNPSIPDYAMEYIRKALENKLDKKQIKTLIKLVDDEKKLETECKKMIADSFIKRFDLEKQFKLYDNQKLEIGSGIYNGLSEDQVKIYASNILFSAELMKNVREIFEKGISVEDFEAHFGPEYEMEKVKNFHKRLSMEDAILKYKDVVDEMCEGPYHCNFKKNIPFSIEDFKEKIEKISKSVSLDDEARNNVNSIFSTIRSFKTDFIDYNSFSSNLSFFKVVYDKFYGPQPDIEKPFYITEDEFKRSKIYKCVFDSLKEAQRFSGEKYLENENASENNIKNDEKIKVKVATRYTEEFSDH